MFEALSKRLFGKLLKKYDKNIEGIKPLLQKANIGMLHRTYVSISLFISLLAFISSFIAIIIISYVLKFNFLMFLISEIMFPALIAFATFLFLWSYPSIRISARKRSIDSNLPLALIHMASIAESGSRPYSLFHIISESKEYGEISVEFKKIIKNVDVFGLDILTAIKDVADKTPSSKLRDFLMEIYTNVQTGGNLGSYIKKASEKSLFDYRIVKEKETRTISTFADFYTALVVAAPLLMIIILSILNTIGGNIFGYAIKDVLFAGIFLGIPIANIMFLLILYLIEGAYYE